MRRRVTTTTHGGAAAPAGAGTPVLDELELREAGRRVAPLAGTRAADLDLRRVLTWWRGFEHQLRTRTVELHGLGAEMERGASAVDEILRQREPHRAGDVFEAVAAGFTAAAGVPALLAPWFTELARTCRDGVGTHQLAEAVRGGLVAVQRAGAPSPGAGSLVDALAPAAEALEGADVAGVPAVAALHAAYRAAANGTRHTVVDGVVDPGALVVTWFFERGTVV
ncbi:DAK2 domain-containing protein [Kineococcus sp. SYSU DK002]|uniref:DAK2 domain-containing protein n=1 Tax=Kineococcus sp. SYSU DK002 TaxID=3383123 RepID=UPI003D7E352F